MATKLDLSALQAPFGNDPRIAAAQATGAFGNILNYKVDPSGQIVAPLRANNAGADAVAGPVEGYARYTPRDDGRYFENQDQFEFFDVGGKFDSMQDFLPDKTWVDTVGPMLVGGMAGLGALGALGGGAAGGAGAVGSGAGFVGEGALSGVAGWDAALAASPSWTAAGGLAAGAGAANGSWDVAGSIGGAGGGVVPPNPFVASATGTAGTTGGSGGLGSLLKGGAGSLMGGGSGGTNWLGMGATALGALAGGQGQSADQSATRQLPPWLQGPVANDLVPRTQGVLGSQMPVAQQAGQQMMTVGGGLLGQTAPTTATNPYVRGILDDLQRRNQEVINRGILQAGGNATGFGGRGGSRQGVVEAEAITRGADNFTGQAANLMGGLYNQDQNRLRQDWTLGSGLLTQGLNTPFQPLRNTADVYSPFTGFGTTSQNTSSGGGWQGALGGAITGASMGRQMGWW